MAAIQTIAVPVTTTGADGSATGSASVDTQFGFLLDAYLDYGATAPNTTDVTIAHAGVWGNLLVVSDNATDGRYAPRSALVDTSAAAITGAYDYLPINGPLTVSVAQANALAPCVTVYLRIYRP